MNVEGRHYRTIWVKGKDTSTIQIIDQRFLPHRFIIEDIKTPEEMATAIRDMHLRGAGLIGAAAGYGLYLAVLSAPKKDFDAYLKQEANKLRATRPTAVNLAWALERQLKAIGEKGTIEDKKKAAFETAGQIADEDAECCRRIGQHGLKLIEEISHRKKGARVNVLTHCNAGWLAFVDYGTALSSVYAAFEKGIDIHVWVDETRPRNQGAQLTAWELGQHGVPHTVIPDNVGGHLMQHGMVDICLVGSDRTTYTGDVANKIGTYLKALAAKDNSIPFYAALPSSTIDWTIRDGVREIPIEQRGNEEVRYIQGLHEGTIKEVLLTPKESPVANYAFDVTPSRLITGIITERGLCPASEKGIIGLYPERRKNAQ
jgi:methylthioribose-1-phosphate isomerase